MPDFEEFEKQFEGVEDPNPFRTQNSENHAYEVFGVLPALTDWLCEDLIAALNLGGVGIMQYLRTDGVSMTTMISGDGRTLGIRLTLPADSQPFISIDEGDPGPEELAANDYKYGEAEPFGDPPEPEVYDPDKDNG